MCAYMHVHTVMRRCFLVFLHQGQHMDSPRTNYYVTDDNKSQGDKHTAQKGHVPEDVCDHNQEWKMVVHKTQTFH